jgi:hypothetical protein
MTSLNIAHLPGRCPLCEFHIELQGCRCSGSDWSLFRAALAQVVTADGLIHQSAVRPLIRGKVAPKKIGTFYRRARAEGLIEDTGEREPSTDFAGRNGDKLSRLYRWLGPTP